MSAGFLAGSHPSSLFLRSVVLNFEELIYVTLLGPDRWPELRPRFREIEQRFSERLRSGQPQSHDELLLVLEDIVRSLPTKSLQPPASRPGLGRLWLDPIPLDLRCQATDALESRDIGLFLGSAGNEHSLRLVYWNLDTLKTLGLFEPALLHAFTASRTNNCRWPLPELRYLFEKADRAQLTAASDPLPGDGPFTIYRGVAGRGSGRRIRGFSWTASLDQAQWFADRAGKWGLHDPAVHRVTVNEADVLAYVGSHRNEDEFIVMPSAAMKPKRIS
jgi:hypothetical protein